MRYVSSAGIALLMGSIFWQVGNKTCVAEPLAFVSSNHPVVSCTTRLAAPAAECRLVCSQSTTNGTGLIVPWNHTSPSAIHRSQVQNIYNIVGAIYITTLFQGM